MRLFGTVLLICIMLLGYTLCVPPVAMAQKKSSMLQTKSIDSITLSMPDTVASCDAALIDTFSTDSFYSFLPDSIRVLQQMADSVLHASKNIKLTRKVSDPQRALWLALVLPGAGQIYNNKYWKLPIIYGGFLGCTYALLWNQQMYKDYSQAYIDIMDDDPNTASYNKMLPYGYNITGREDQFKTIFKHKKDFYRKNRDLSIFAFFGVYIFSVIDAYVDAQLATFDISPDLSMKIEPTVIQQNTAFRRSNTFGVQCSFNF